MKLKHILIGLILVVIALLVGGYAYLSSLDFNELKAQIQEEVRTATGRELAIDGDVDLALSLTPALRVEGVSFSNAEWGSAPSMVELDRFELEVALLPLISSQIEINRLVLSGGRFLLETDPSGQGNWSFGPEEAAASEAPADSSGGDFQFNDVRLLSIENSELVFKDGRSGESQSIKIEKMEIAREGSGLLLDIAGSYQEVPFSLAGTSGRIMPMLEGADFPFDLAGSLADAKIALSGSLSGLPDAPTPDVTFSVKGPSFASFNALAGGGLPDLGPYDLSGTLQGTPEEISLSALVAKIGGSDLAGAVTLSLAGRPKVFGNLTSNLIDLADFEMAEAEADGASSPAGSSTGEESAYVIPETPLPLEGLKAVDADLALDIASLKVDEKLEASGLGLKLLLDAGNLTISDLKGLFYDGQLSGGLNLDASQDRPALVTQVTFAGFDYGKMLKAQDVSKDVEGRLDMTIDLKGAGTSARAIASSLNGTTEIIGSEGVITNKILALVGSGMNEIGGPLFGGKDTTGLNCIVSRFDIIDGLATSKGQVIDTDNFSIAGGGTVDLKTEKLDLAFDTSSRVEALVSLAIPFRVKGTMKDPKITPDPAGALGAVSNILGDNNPLAALSGGGSSSQSSADSDNPCVTALDSDAQPAAATEQKQEPANAIEKAIQSVGGDGDEVEKAGEALDNTIGEGLKSLFGD